MNKKTQILHIDEKKAYIDGILLSLLFSIIVSLISSNILINLGLGEGKITTTNLLSLLIPLIFVIFEMFALSFTIILNVRNKKLN